MSIAESDRCRLRRDIDVGGATAFRRGEVVTVEKVDPHPARPANRYVVTSSITGKRYQLSDDDLESVEGPSPTRGAVVRASRRARWWWIIPAAVVAIAAFVAALLFLLPSFGDGTGGGGEAWAVGDRGEILRSTDGGRTWKRSVEVSTAGYRAVTSPEGGLALIGGESAGGGPAVISVSTEQGSRKASGLPSDTGTVNGLDSAAGETAWAVGGVAGDGEGERPVEGESPVEGFVWTSGDGGSNWTIVDAGDSPELMSVSATEGGVVYGVGKGGTIIGRKGAGAGWAPQPSDVTTDLLSVFTVDDRRAYAVGVDGVIQKTDNGGETWYVQESGTDEHLYSVTAVDGEKAWAAGTQGIVLKTEDGGKSWKPVKTVTEMTLRGIAAFNDKDLVAVGDGGTVMTTSDGGESWSKSVSGTDSDLLSVAVSGQ